MFEFKLLIDKVLTLLENFKADASIGEGHVERRRGALRCREVVVVVSRCHQILGNARAAIKDVDHVVVGCAVVVFQHAIDSLGHSHRGVAFGRGREREHLA